jgi:serine/threonine-protein kinase
VVPVTLSRRPTPTPTPAPGLLQFRVSPWAEVSVDGKVVGTTPFKPVRLEAGDHQVILSNPSFMPLHKKVTILPGQTLMLEVDLSFEAFPKR